MLMAACYTSRVFIPPSALGNTSILRNYGTKLPSSVGYANSYTSYTLLQVTLAGNYRKPSFPVFARNNLPSPMSQSRCSSDRTSSNLGQKKARCGRSTTTVRCRAGNNLWVAQIPGSLYGPAAAAGAAILLASLILLIKFTMKEGRKSSKKVLPPGPKGLPVIGIMHKLSSLPHEDFAKLAGQYGPLVSFHLGQQLCVVASSPATIMEFLKNQDVEFSNRPHFRVADVVMTHDITFQENTPSWRNLRKIFNANLTGPKRIAATQFVRNEEAFHMVRSIPRHGVPVEMNLQITGFAANVLSRTILNKRLGGAAPKTEPGDYNTDKTLASYDELREVQDFKEIVEEILQTVGTFNLGDLIPALRYLDVQGLESRYKKIKVRMDAFVMNIISEHMKQRSERKADNLDMSEGDQRDMVDFLLDQMEATDESAISLDNVKSLIWNAFSGGTKTVIDTSVWAMTEIVRNPEVMRKAHAELDNVIGRSRMVQESDISSLEYIRAIVKETLRLHPPIPMLVPHISPSTCEALGYTIPANTWIFFNVWAIGRDESIWKNPLEFNPDRFMTGNQHEDVDFQGQDFELLPFGSGRRGCPGLSMGSRMIHLIVASMLHAFDWALPMEDEKMDLSKGNMSDACVVSKAQLLSAIPTPRLSSHLYQ